VVTEWKTLADLSNAQPVIKKVGSVQAKEITEFITDGTVS
jgi:hypothetical protein